jgi:lysophospholipase L1-like esterase
MVVSLLAAGCSSSTGPTPPPPPPTEDPPKITCPASQTIQLTSGTSIAVTYATPTIANGKPPVTLACVPPSGSVFNVGSTTVVCTATDALQRPDSCSMTVTVTPPVIPILAVTSFVAFGDSITRGEDGTNGPPTAPCSSTASARMRFGPRVILPDAQTYPGVLAQSLSARYKAQSPTVDNQGCPGEAVTDAGTLSRFDGLIRSRRYEAVLIMEGSNDLMLATKDSNVFAAALVRLRQLVGDAKSRGVRPLLATIPPINPAGSRGKDWGANMVPDFNAGVRGIAQGEGVPLVDVNAAFNGNLSLLGSDGLHPTPEGYRVVAGAFADTIKNTLEIPPASKPPTLSPLFRRR